VTEVVVTVVGAVLLFLFGRWQAEHERLYERRAEVIARLFECVEDLDQKCFSLFHWLDSGGEPDKPQKAKLAADSFNEMQGYYRRNSIWLTPRTSAQVNDFLNRYKKSMSEFNYEVIGRQHQLGEVEKWHEIWTSYQKESPEIRQTLETEFRAALGSWRARLTLLSKEISSYRTK